MKDVEQAQTYLAEGNSKLKAEEKTPSRSMYKYSQNSMETNTLQQNDLGERN